MRNVARKSDVKEAYISSSGVGKALAKRRQRHVWKPRQGCRDLSEPRTGRASIVKEVFSTRSNRIAHERTSCRKRLLMCQHKHQQHQSPLCVNTVSAPAQTSDPAIAATSAQLQVEGKRNDGDNLEHGCKPTVETKRDSKRLRQKQPPRFLERRKDLRLTSSFWNLMEQTALRLRHSSSSCKTRLLTEGKTLTCSSKCFRRLSLMPATPSS